MKLEDFRREYLRGGLHREDLRDDPVEQFGLWMEQVVAGGLTDPTAMVLATVEPDASPWQRIVLLKDFGPQGFVFYTNAESRKSLAMTDNTRVSLLFPWNVLERQVIIGGVAEKLPQEDTARYFASRPRESQIAAWASDQSRPLPTRSELEQKVEEVKRRFADGEVTLPPFWGGYRVMPQQMEFWQGGEYRLHDRFLYTRQDDSTWTVQRLAP